MKKQQWLLGVGLLAFIGLLVSATLLYDSLAATNAPDNFMSANPVMTEDTVTQSVSDPAVTSSAVPAPPDAAPAETNPATATTAVEEATTTASEKVLQLAPDFTVTDRSGNTVKLSDLRGKPVILNFWASWCEPCQVEMPAFQQAYETLGDEICFMMVNVTDGSRETLRTAQAYMDGQSYTFPVYFDTTLEASILYGAYAIPLTVFLDAEGYLVAYASGALNTATLQKSIDMILVQ